MKENDAIYLNAQILALTTIVKDLIITLTTEQLRQLHENLSHSMEFLAMQTEFTENPFAPKQMPVFETFVAFTESHINKRS